MAIALEALDALILFFGRIALVSVVVIGACFYFLEAVDWYMARGKWARCNTCGARRKAERS